MARCMHHRSPRPSGNSLTEKAVACGATGESQPQPQSHRPTAADSENRAIQSLQNSFRIRLPKEKSCAGAAQQPSRRRCPRCPTAACRAAMSSTPRAKPMVAKESASPRAAPAAGKSAAEKKPKAKKPKGSVPTVPMSLGMPMNKPADLTEEAAKSDLEALQKKYGALVVNFNNQQAELAAAQRQIHVLEDENSRLKGSSGLSGDAATASLQSQLDQTLSELRSLESTNMQLQKKVNKLQVEHVSEEEVDQVSRAHALSRFCARPRRHATASKTPVGPRASPRRRRDSTRAASLTRHAPAARACPAALLRAGAEGAAARAGDAGQGVAGAGGPHREAAQRARRRR